MASSSTALASSVCTKAERKAEEQVALQVLVLRGGDLRALLRALQAQLALVVALMQIAEVGLHLRAPVGCQ